MCEYEVKGQRITYPRLIKVVKGMDAKEREQIIYRSIERGLDKGERSSYREEIDSQTVSKYQEMPFSVLLVKLRRKLKLSTFAEGHREGFNRRVSEDSEAPISLYDCFRNYSAKERLEKENTVYCNKCKEHRESTKQM